MPKEGNFRDSRGDSALRIQQKCGGHFGRNGGNMFAFEGV